jgi:hypothetical protein
MSELEQAAAYLRLKKESKGMQNEIAALEADIRKAGGDFAALGDWLKECGARARNTAWDSYATLIADLPKKVARHSELQVQKADVDGQLAKFVDMD